MSHPLAAVTVVLLLALVVVLVSRQRLKRPGARRARGDDGGPVAAADTGSRQHRPHADHADGSDGGGGDGGGD